MQMPSRILGAIYHASTSPLVLPAVAAHVPSPRSSCRELQAIRLAQQNTKKEPRRGLPCLPTHNTCMTSLHTSSPRNMDGVFVPGGRSMSSISTLPSPAQVPTRSAPAGRPTPPGDRRSESTPPKKSRQTTVPATSGVGQNAERESKKQEKKIIRRYIYMRQYTPNVRLRRNQHKKSLKKNRLRRETRKKHFACAKRTPPKSSPAAKKDPHIFFATAKKGAAQEKHGEPHHALGTW